MDENYHKFWKHRWLTPKAKPFKSGVHGIGLMAIKPIAKGEVVQVVGGIIVPRSQILEYRKSMGHIGIQIHDNFWMVPADRKEVEETGAPNHSCEPNIGFEGSNIYVAIQNINPKEEIFVDYAFMESYFEPFECKCGSPKCRKIITPDDWKIKEIQDKHGNYFSPYLKRKLLTKNK